MFEYVIIGSGFAFAAALQPGPLQAYLLSSVLQRGWRRTLPAAFAPLLSDGPIVVIALLVLTRISEEIQIILRLGEVFFCYIWPGRVTGIGNKGSSKTQRNLSQHHERCCRL